MIILKKGKGRIFPWKYRQFKAHINLKKKCFFYLNIYQYVFWLFDGFHKILLNNVGYIHYTIAINEQWTPFNYNISIHLKKKIMNQFDFF